MASLHRRKGSNYWYASFRVPIEIDPTSGRTSRSKQILRCTKSTDRSEALRVAVKIEEAEKNAAGAGEENSRKLLGVLSRATDFAVKGLLSEPLARQFLEELYKVSNSEGLENFSFSEWGAEWLAGKKRTVKPSTLKLYDLAVRKFGERLGEKANSRIELLSTQELEHFRNQIHDEGRSAKTANQYLKSLSSCLKAAVDRGILLKNPCDSIQPLPESDSVKRKPFSMPEIKLLLDAADDEWRAVILTALYTGLRLRDVTDLRWIDVDLKEEILRVEPKKQSRKTAQKKILTIPLHPAVLAQFKRIHGLRNRSEILFPNLAKKPTGGRYGLAFYFNRIMEKAGVDPENLRIRSKGEKGRAVTAKGFHSLRHTFVSLLAEQEVDRELRKKLAGHSDERSHDIYTHIRMETLRQAVGRLPSPD